MKHAQSKPSSSTKTARQKLLGSASAKSIVRRQVDAIEEPPAQKSSKGKKDAGSKDWKPPSNAPRPLPAQYDHVGVPQAPPLLYSRRQTAKLFADSSVATIIRLEKDGRLKAVKLSKKPTAMTYYYARDVHALVESLSSRR